MNKSPYHSVQQLECQQRIINSLKRTFVHSDQLENAICADQHTKNLDEAMAKWLCSFLLFDDHQFSLVLVPIIAQRFDSYINQLRNNSPWIM